jgi:MYND finger
MNRYKETVLETGHVLMHCQHNREFCHKCCVDFREMNDAERQASEALLSKKEAKRQEKSLWKGSCHAEGCDNKVSGLCTRCRSVGYCSARCQKRDWAHGHKEQCKSALPTFVNSVTQKHVVTYPVGTKMEMLGGRSPFFAKIRKFNPPGTGRPNDCTAEELATYSMQACGGTGDNEVFDEPCEDIHDRNAWRKCDE